MVKTRENRVKWQSTDGLQESIQFQRAFEKKKMFNNVTYYIKVHVVYNQLSVSGETFFFFF